MNEILAIINSRKSLPTYADTPISEIDKELIINSATRAPTAGNMMLYSILEFTDQEKKKQLVKTCDNQPFLPRAMRGRDHFFDIHVFNSIVKENAIDCISIPHQIFCAVSQGKASTTW